MILDYEKSRILNKKVLLKIIKNNKKIKLKKLKTKV